MLTLPINQPLRVFPLGSGLISYVYAKWHWAVRTNLKQLIMLWGLSAKPLIPMTSSTSNCQFSPLTALWICLQIHFHLHFNCVITWVSKYYRTSVEFHALSNKLFCYKALNNIDRTSSLSSPPFRFPQQSQSQTMASHTLPFQIDVSHYNMWYCCCKKYQTVRIPKLQHTEIKPL